MKNAKLWTLLEQESQKRVFLPAKEIDIESLKNNNQDLFDFAKNLQDNFNKEDLANFYHNVADLKIVLKNTDKSYRHTTLGFYEPFSQTLMYKNESPLATLILFHELFHMSGTYISPDIIYSGFFAGLKKIKKERIGNCINEGYTEILAERYNMLDVKDIKGYEKIRKNYSLPIYISDNIERIVSKNKMTKLYLNGDLWGLMSELEKYISLDEIKKFLINTDTLYKINTSPLAILFNKRIIQTFRNVNYFLMKAYSKKLTMYLLEHKIDMFIYINNLSNFIFSIVNEICTFKTFEIFSIADLKTCLNETWQELFMTDDLTLKLTK